MRATLLRFADSPFGVFGYLDLLDDTDHRMGRFCAVEDDWLDNLPSLSCIPAGSYTCRRTLYLKGGYPTYEVTGVPERSRILFHVANTEEDVGGCIGLGKKFGGCTVKDEDDPAHWPVIKWAVLRSAEAFKQFMGLLDGVDEFVLEVSWSAPGAWRVA